MDEFERILKTNELSTQNIDRDIIRIENRIESLDKEFTGDLDEDQIREIRQRRYELEKSVETLRALREEIYNLTERLRISSNYIDLEELTKKFESLKESPQIVKKIDEQHKRIKGLISKLEQ